MLQTIKKVTVLCVAALALAALTSCTGTGNEEVEVVPVELDKGFEISYETTPIVDFIVPDNVGEDIEADEEVLEYLLDALTGRHFDGGSMVVRFERDGLISTIDHYGNNVSAWSIVSATDHGGVLAADILINDLPWQVELQNSELTLTSEDFAFVGVAQ